MIIKVILSTFVLCVSVFAETWDMHIKKDKMSGEISAYASSPATTSNEKMQFPYSDTKSWIGVGCKDGKEWAYFGFNKSPNLLNTETQSGYNVLYAKIKIGKTIDTVKLTQEWGDRFLSISDGSKYANFLNPENLIEKLKQGSSILLELNWYGNGKTYFTYSLKGSTRALKKMQNECKVRHLPAKAYKNKNNIYLKVDNKSCKDKSYTYIKVDNIDGCVEIKPYEDESGNDIIRNTTQLTKEEKCMLLGGYIDTSNNICKIWKKK